MNATSPAAPVPTVEQALQLHQTGQFAAAEGAYNQLIAADPGCADAWHLRGLLLNQTGRVAEAVNDLKQAIVLNPNDAEAYSNLGLVLLALRRTDEALLAWQQAIRTRPDYPAALQQLGALLWQVGRPEEAVTHLRRALDLQPDFHDAALELGNALKGLGQREAAADSFRRAVELRPDSFAAHNNLAMILQELGKYEEALDCIARAIDSGPERPELHSLRGVCLQELGRVDQAVDSYRRALELDPEYREAHHNLGYALHWQGKVEQAAASYRESIRLGPHWPDSYNNLASLLKDQGRLDEALANYRLALINGPINGSTVGTHSNLVYAMLFSPNFSAAAIQRSLAAWREQHADPLRADILPHSNDRSPERRLRIGYVSPEFYDHVVGRNLLPVFRHHDRHLYELFAYSNVQREDRFTALFKQATEHWRDTVRKNDAEVAEMIRADQIDILIDLSLHMRHNRLLTFARKPAPVQITFGGYPGSTGLTTIDYRLTDPHLDPPESDLSCYSEQPLWLPATWWCYDPFATEPSVNRLPAGLFGRVTFGCLNNFCKVNDNVLCLWARVMRELPSSRLTILSDPGSHRQHTVDVLVEAGIAADRITFVDKRPRLEYLRLFHGIDICLDTFPYNGHTTSLDSLWMGVPVVTLVGSTVVGRAGVSQLTNLGLGELIAETPDRFVDIAVGLSRDLPRLTRLRATLRERMEGSPLMNATSFTRGIEQAYRTAWRRWCATPAQE